MFGSHLSIAGGMFHALETAAEQKMDCVQVYKEPTTVENKTITR